MAKVVLKMQNITKSFGSLVANHRLNLDLKQGEILALLGENGAGKTTLMHILFGHYLADSGSIEAFEEPLELGNPKAALKRGLGIVHQHFALVDNLKVFENILLGDESHLQPYQKLSKPLEKLKRINQQTNFSIALDKKIKELSVGEKQKVEILKILYRDAKILILDEPTAVLTPQEATSLFLALKKLAKDNISIIFISHKLKEIMEISKRIYVLRQGRLVYETQTRKATIEKLAKEMVGYKIIQKKKKKLTQGETLLKLKNIHTKKQATKKALENINLELHRQEILGITGIAGNGQKELAEMIFGLIKHSEGSFSLQGAEIKNWSCQKAVQSGLSRIPEDRQTHGVIGSMKIWENLVNSSYTNYSKASFLKTNKIKELAKELVEKFDIRCSSIEDRTSLLSGGNIQKLILAREFFNQPEVIVAHQPTRGLDIGAINMVHKNFLKAREDGSGILLITEELDELLLLSDRIAVMYEGNLSPFYKKISLENIGLLMSGKNIFDNKGK